ncbi:hypothetical protein BDV93DRAFT_610283 [Ceratobasidium sp. AG-I]|nr:hypothetical protein BDV93DRAFT_610283 [Ceratobasidium sp. AG-I]
MQHVVQLGPDSKNPFPLLVTTTRKSKNGGEDLVETFRLEEMAWSDPIGAALRNDQVAEIDLRYGEPAKEPGVTPCAEDVALFLVSYPASAADGPDLADAPKSALKPVACGALRDLGDGYMEIKRMYAAQSVRGTGAALSIIIALECYAHGLGMKAVRLETGLEQKDAMKFYERNGYVPIPLFGHYTDAVWSRCYEKTLGGVA